jgi:hypothetical protein
MEELSPTEKRIDDLSGQVGRFEDRFVRFEGKVDHKFERLEDKIDYRFAKWDKIAIGVGMSMVGGVVSIAGAVVYKVLGL